MITEALWKFALPQERLVNMPPHYASIVAETAASPACPPYYVPSDSSNSAADAYGQALALMPDQYHIVAEEPNVKFAANQVLYIDNNVPNGHWSATAAKSRYRIVGYSVTGFLRVWYTVTKTTSYSGPDFTTYNDTQVTHSTVEISFVTGANGLIVPGNMEQAYPDYLSGVDPGSVGAHDRMVYQLCTASDASTVAQEAPPTPISPHGFCVSASSVQTMVQVDAYSCLSNYTPVNPGENGFPP